MYRVMLLLLSLWSVSAFSQSPDKLACILKHEMSMGTKGEEMEVHSNNDPAKFAPEDVIFFDFKKMVVTYPWIDFEYDDAYMEQDKLVKVNNQLYYAQYTDGVYVSYSSYLFDENKELVHLTEIGFLSMYLCEPGDMADIERKYQINFSEYK